MGEVFRDFKNEFLEITMVKKQWQIIEILFQEIFAEMGIDLEIFLNKLAEDENSIEKLVHIHFEFLKYPNKNVA
ncbi:MAG: hypothetical protein RLZZ417_2607 [Bacteroidota bacterium]